MKYIEKTLKNEPASLKEYRSTPGAGYNDCNKIDIRLALLNEQGYICAYCNQRIKEGYDNNGQPFTSIEHYKAQTDDKIGDELKLNYLNMLGVCNGNKGNPKHLQHCDKSRGNVELFINPIQKDCEQFIKYENDGTIYSDDERVDNDLDNILNLNNDRFIKGRKAVMDIAVKEMNRKYKKKKGQTWSKRDLKTEIKYWEKRVEKKHHPFCQVAIFYLNKKLSRLT